MAFSCCAPTPTCTRSKPCCAPSSFGPWNNPSEPRKHLFATRPIFHQLDETIRGHVFCRALVLKSALDDRIAALERDAAWPDILADLDSLTETAVEQDGKRFFVRSAPRPTASLALRAAGVALPPTVRAAVEA